MPCHGNGQNHCCNLGQRGECEFVEENTIAGRRWACGLLRELGSWESVEADPRYLKSVKPFFDEYMPGVSCGSWPPKDMTGPGMCCFGDA